MATDFQKSAEISQEERFAAARELIDKDPTAITRLEAMAADFQTRGATPPYDFTQALEYARSKEENTESNETQSSFKETADESDDGIQTPDDSFLENEISENSNKGESLVAAVSDIEKAPSSSPLEAIKPAVMGTQERHRHSIVPLKNTNGKLTGYEVTSPSGNQKFVVDAENMEMKILHDTIIGNESDAQEVLSVFDLVFKVKSAMKAIGVKESDIPTDPIEIAEKARLLIVKAAEIQKARTEFEMENATQAFLRLYIRVMSGSKKDSNSLNSDQKEQIKTFGDILMVHMLRKMGIDDEDKAVAQTIVDVDRLLRERKTTAMIMEWHEGGRAAGGAVGGFVGGLLGKGTEGVVTPIASVLFGKEKAENGLVDAVKDAGGEIIDGVTTATVNKVGEVIDRAARYVGVKKDQPEE